jgi:uncharacterized protein
MKTKTDAENIPITSIDLDITNDCQLQCDYCVRGKKNKQSMTWEVGAQAIDFLIRYSQDRKKVKVVLFGGEPLLEFDLIKKLVPYAQRKASYYGKAIHFRAVTNCVLVNDEIIEFFHQHRMEFLTSIDGGPESQDKHRHFPDGRGTSAIIEPKVKRILECWPNTIARVTLANDIAHRWMQDTMYLMTLGYKNIVAVPRPECVWTKEELRCLRRELRKIANFYIERFRTGNPVYIEPIERAVRSIVKPSRPRHACEVGKRHVAVKTNGTIYPCTGFDPQSTFGRDEDGSSDDEWRLGSVFTGLDHEKRKIFLDFDSRSQTEADCENCLAVHMCGHQCIAANWSSFHDIYKPHPDYCKLYNIYFVEALRIHYILKSENNRHFIQKFYSRNQARQAAVTSEES